MVIGDKSYKFATEDRMSLLSLIRIHRYSLHEIGMVDQNHSVGSGVTLG